MATATLPSKREISTALKSVEVQLEFDYERAGVTSADQKALEKIGSDIEDKTVTAHEVNTANFLEVGALFSAAKTIFGADNDGHITDFGRAHGWTAQRTNGAILCHEKFGDRRDDAMLFSPTALMLIAKTEDAKFIKRMLDAAAQSDVRHVSVEQVRAIMGEREPASPEKTIEFKTNNPKTLKEAAEYFTKKAENCQKRWDGEIAADVPKALMMAASALKSKA
jgi:hypothetical protein